MDYRNHNYNGNDSEQFSGTVLISNIQRFCVHDGPGIRTTVFVLGCPLRCRWCQNPENLTAKKRLMLYPDECIGCWECIRACPEAAIYADENRHLSTNRDRCKACGACTKVCYSQARKLCGKNYTVDGLFKELLKDKVTFYETSGGVTLSGGEFALYPEFVCELFKKCKKEHINTAIESSGCVRWTNLEAIEKFTDLFLYDVKLIDPIKHKKWTGADNSLILENLKKLSERGKSIIVRVPLIPGANDDEKEFTRIAEYVKALKGIQAIHILPFHQLGSAKYGSVGKQYSLADLKEENEERIEKCKLIAQNLGLIVDVGGSEISSKEYTRQKSREDGYFIYKF